MRRFAAILLALGAGIAGSARDAWSVPATAAGPAARVVRIDADSLGLGALSVLTLHPSGRTAYLAREDWRDDPRRENLVALRLGADGRPAGPPHRYPATAWSVPPGTNARIRSLWADARLRKLYVGFFVTIQGVFTPIGEQPGPHHGLTVYDLDDNGLPAGPPRDYESGADDWQVTSALATHPKMPVLYLAQGRTNRFFAVALDANGNPLPGPRLYELGGQAKEALAVSEDGKRLYLGAYPDELDTLELDERGFPRPDTLRVFHAGAERDGLRFAFTPQALYLARENGAHAARWALEGGLPAGEPKAIEGRFAALAADPTSGEMRQAPGRGVLASRLASETLVQLVRADPKDAGAPSHWKARVRLLEGTRQAGAPARGPYEAELSIHAKKLFAGKLRPLQPTEWIELDPLLAGEARALPLTLRLKGGAVSSLEARLEIAGAESRVLAVRDEQVQGATAIWLLPGDARPVTGARISAVESLSAQAARHLKAARKSAIAPPDRPREFTTTPYGLWVEQHSRAQLADELGTLARLGMNTLLPAYSSDFAPAELGAALARAGFAHRAFSVYSPPRSFSFEGDTTSLAPWASQQRERYEASGGTPKDLALFMLSDEPGWYLPESLEKLRALPRALASFRAYLPAHGLEPRDLGASDWKGVLPAGAGASSTLPGRRLFYWSTRFLQDAFADGIRQAREALQAAFGRELRAAVNLNRVGTSYFASPGAPIFNGGDRGPDSAAMFPELFRLARKRAALPWTEDWFRDAGAQDWSFYGDYLRSAAALSGEDFGGYVVGRLLGDHPHGASYKVLSLAGHGAKLLTLYAFGPESSFPGNSWSENTEAYPAIAEAFRTLGQAERVLYPARPARGHVALYCCGTSELWSPSYHEPDYRAEIRFLHYALVHAGYSVDFVDDTDIAGGELGRRGYSVLYVTEPNLAAGALARIREWVGAGGVLAVTPGAAVADEYDTPSSALDPVLGLAPRTAIRDSDPIPEANDAPVDRLVAQAPGLPARMGLLGRLGGLKPEGARILARLSGGAPAVTTHAYGKGRALAYAFFPGLQYWASPSRASRFELPRGWSADARAAAAYPARAADTPRDVVADHEGVEVDRLESPAGIALVILNWTDEPIARLGLEIPHAGRFGQARSVARGGLAAQPVPGGGVRLELPVGATDVVLLEAGGP